MKLTFVLLSFFMCQIWYQVNSAENESSSSGSSSEESAEVKAECAKELGIPESMIKKLEEDATLFSEENNRCYVKCVFEKIGIVDNEGKYDAKTTQEILTHLKDVKIHLPECEEASEHENICDKVYMVYECLNGDE